MRHLLDEMQVGGATANTWRRFIELWDGAHILEKLFDHAVGRSEVRESKALIHSLMKLMR